MNINGISSISGNEMFKIDKAGFEEAQESEVSFQDFLKQSIKEVNELQVDAENKNIMLATGKIENIHDVTIASEKAKVALDLTLAVRTKVVDAYREIMRMQV
ncbi:flagellar hook-basal body complex protein FliE [Andreesenia angusta]|uniref:Flagellar hook-basal body complex protein FliE n=2 Tax=Andreesenia angusta TaxID=39480 RepID=A0A1S1V821_9FIRM|nr:flagellar hook-basal body complex protein FliE [Andreesenia angusta]